jgi:hypothetical protein
MNPMHVRRVSARPVSWRSLNRNPAERPGFERFIKEDGTAHEKARTRAPGTTYSIGSSPLYQDAGRSFWESWPGDALWRRSLRDTGRSSCGCSRR